MTGPGDLGVSGGNASVLVMIDSSGGYWDRMIVGETILSALDHFGIPYRPHDLSRDKLSAEILAGCACIILGQDKLGRSISEVQASLISEAVKAGTGLVSFDGDLRLYSDAYLEIFGFEEINPYPYATNLLRIRQNRHAVTGMQEDGELHSLDKMVTAVMAGRWRDDVEPLADGILGKDQLVYIRHLCPRSAYEPRNHSLLFAARWGEGKAVQFCLNPRVWRKSFYGHARSMDDLFWRSVVWAARKPFVANLVPPFVTMSIDDCSGRHDFRYVDIACKHGYIPLPSLFLKHVPEGLFGKIRNDTESGKALYNSHALSYYDLMLYDFGKGELSQDRLQKNFSLEDAWWQKTGCLPSLTNRYHWGEYGLQALPFLKERDRVFFSPALQMGLHKADMCMDDGYWPYNLQSCYYDFLPDNSDFFGFASFPARHQEDFLIGCTALLRENDRNDVEKSAQSAARKLRDGLRAGFHGELTTHEQKFDVLSLDQWDEILRRAGELTASNEKIFANHDEIATYLRAKRGVTFTSVSGQDGRITCRIEGAADRELKLSVFEDEGDDFVRSYSPLEAFSGSTELSLQR